MNPLPFAEWAEQQWLAALAVWGVNIHLTRPMRWKSAEDRPNEPLAYIDMGDRQIVVNFEYLSKIQAMPSLAAVLAHEIGHHIRFPHTLGFAASLECLQRRLLPWYGPSLTNLFFDLQVNEVVGRTMAEDLCRVYRGFVGNSDGLDPLFTVYLAVYEELWCLEADDLIGAGAPPGIDAQFPAWRASARVFAQTFYSLVDPYQQFVYFCSVFQRFLGTDPASACHGPMSSDAALPDVDDYAGAIRGNPQAERALRRAVEAGWIDDPGGPPTDAMSAVARVTAGRPGTAQVQFRRALTERIYRQRVDEHLFTIPPDFEGKEPDSYLPSTTEDWSWGESVNRIDWTASVLASGDLAAVMPLQRALLPADPDPRGAGVPSIEIYLDTSGSMPDPQQAINALTLAAHVLATAAIRQGGLVRAVVYSSGTPMVSEWFRDETTARDFLLNYSGGGTDFPFKHLVASVDERPEAVRVVITDSDFLYNYARGGEPLLLQALGKCRRFVALLSLYDAASGQKALANALASPAFALVTVRSMSDLGGAAAALARGLFGGA